METISLSTALYSQAKDYAKEQNMTVDEWVTMLIMRFVPSNKKGYRMRNIEELSPELQRLIGFAKPTAAQVEDLNGDKARMGFLTDKYAL